MKYALGVWLKYNWIYDFQRVIIRIAQPRLDHFDVWELSVAELLAFGAEIKADLSRVWDPDAPFNPGEKQCKFCKVAARCRPLHDHINRIRGIGFEDETVAVNPNLLTNEELVEAWRTRNLVLTHFDAIARVMMQEMLRGEEMPGVKLVQGVTHRKWKDEGAAKEKLIELGLPPAKLVKQSFISPNQAEELLSKSKHHEICDLWVKPPGGPAIVDASDKRDAYVGAVPGGGFENEEFDDGFGN